jgi:methylthioribose-1-phosphate isomerase
VIEERKADELRYWNGAMITPKCVAVYNPAFDATPMENVTAIITEHGTIRPPLQIAQIRKKFMLKTTHMG